MGRDHAKNSNSGWRKHQTKNKWHAIVAVLISVTLMFAIINGLTKGISIKDNFSSSKWDGKSSFSIAIGSENSSLFIFQPDLNNLVVFTISGETLYETGDSNKPYEELAKAIERGGSDYITAMSKTYESKIDNYIINKRSDYIDDVKASIYFDQFVSLTTPLKLIGGNWGENGTDTNITRIDAFKLWWKTKSLSAEQLIVTDLSSLKEEIILNNEQTVLGADQAALSRSIAKYLENFTIREENLSIKIINGSGSRKSLELASAFVANVGGSISAVEISESVSTTTKILSSNKNSYTAKYLANIFNCDINEAKTSVKQDEIILILGEDFTARYYE